MVKKRGASCQLLVEKRLVPPFDFLPIRLQHLDAAREKISFVPITDGEGFTEVKVDKKEEAVSFLGLKRRFGKTKSSLKPSITMESDTDKVYPKITDPENKKSDRCYNGRPSATPIFG